MQKTNLRRFVLFDKQVGKLIYTERERRRSTGGSKEWAVSTNRTSLLGSFEAALNLVTRIIGHFQSLPIFSHQNLDFFMAQTDTEGQTKQVSRIVALEINNSF